MAADGLVLSWGAKGFDRTVRVTGADGQPGEMVFNMTLMEYLTHGWDLATATHQPIPYSEAEAAEVLARAERTLPRSTRATACRSVPSSPSPSTPAVDRMIGFMGRHP